MVRWAFLLHIGYNLFPGIQHTTKQNVLLSLNLLFLCLTSCLFVLRLYVCLSECNTPLKKCPAVLKLASVFNFFSFLSFFVVVLLNNKKQTKDQETFLPLLLLLLLLVGIVQGNCQQIISSNKSYTLPHTNIHLHFYTHKHTFTHTNTLLHTQILFHIQTHTYTFTHTNKHTIKHLL